jgi:small subunit ribosomal protein S6
MKRNYEGVIILNTIGKEESIDKMVKRVGDQIEAEGGRLEQIDRMGRKEFAYPNNKISAGFYVNYFFEAEPAVIDKIQSALKLNEDVHVQHYQVLAAAKA